MENRYDDPPEGLAERLGQPGSYPFTRGIYRGMYSERLWTMRQYAGFGSAAEYSRLRRPSPSTPAPPRCAARGST